MVAVPEFTLGATQSNDHEVELLEVCVTLAPFIDTPVPAFEKEPLSAVTENPPAEPAERLTETEYVEPAI